MGDEQTDRLRDWFNAEVTPCGSRITCNPAPKGSDADYFVLTDGDVNLSKLMTYLNAEGWQWEGASEHYQNVAANSFTSFRKDDDNLIVTTNPDFARRHKVATRLCTRLNLSAKADRVVLFQAILYGNTEYGL